MLALGCAEPEAQKIVEWSPLPPKQRAAPITKTLVPTEPLSFAAPTAFVPMAPARPEFLARDNICKRAATVREPGCANEWTAACDQALMIAAYMAPNSVPTTGSCYYHDRGGCPDCACDYYVKVNKRGFDGGTGCLGTPEDVLSRLYGECAAQRCEPRGP